MKRWVIKGRKENTVYIIIWAAFFSFCDTVWVYGCRLFSSAKEWLWDGCGSFSSAREWLWDGCRSFSSAREWLWDGCGSFSSAREWLWDGCGSFSSAREWLWGAPPMWQWTRKWQKCVLWTKNALICMVLFKKLRRWKMYRNAPIFACCFRREIEEMKDVQNLHAVLDGKLRRWKTYRNAPIFTCCFRQGKSRRWKTYRNALIFACCFRQEIQEMKDIQKCSDFCMVF